MLKATLITLGSFAAVFAIGYFVITSGGKPISSDLAMINQNKPTLVLAYENYSPTGGDALNRLRSIKSDYELRLDFIVADVGTPKGLEFSDSHQLIDGQAIILMPNGKNQRFTRIPEEEQELRQRLDSILEPSE